MTPERWRQIEERFHAFWRLQRGGRRSVWTIAVGGDDPVVVADDDFENWNPVWSPDGRHLAYYRNNDNTFIIETAKPWAEQTPQALPEADVNLKTFLPSSWSGDGLKLAGWQQAGANQSAGILVYSFASQRYQKLTDSGLQPRWLSDNRRLMFSHMGKLQIVDSQTGKIETVMDITPDTIFGFTLSTDERQLYFTHASTEIDIWLSEIQ